MMKKNTKFLSVSLFLILFVTPFLGFKSINETDRQFVERVYNKILTVVKNVPPELAATWPPKLDYQADEKKVVNAYAGFNDEGYPVVIVTQALMDVVIRGNEEFIAYILAHEIGHHLGMHPKNLTNYVESRSMEFEADKYGMEIVLRAGYSFRTVRETMIAMKSILGDYSTFEASASTHPSWTERLEALDSEKQFLWRSLAAFENGVYFLFYENYEAAEVCFKKAIREFPDCYEAYANLGYAQLMQYLDKLEYEDVRSFNINQIIYGSFYRKAVSIEQSSIRGIDEEIWWNAIGNFKEALRINPNMSLVKTNLGIAYLFDPRKKSLGQAEKFFAESIDEIALDESIDQYLVSIVYLNSGVVDATQNKNQEALAKFENAKSRYENAQKQGFAMNNESNTDRGFSSVVGYDVKSLAAVIDLNSIILESSSKSENPQFVKNAINEFEKYFRNHYPGSIWWKLAYENYTALCKKAALTPKSEEQLVTSSRASVKPVQGIKVGSNLLLLSTPINEALKMFDGEAEVLPVVKERKIMAYVYANLGIEIISDTKIVSIVLNSNYKEPLEFQGVKGNKYQLKIGMTRKEVEKLLLDENDLIYMKIQIPGKSATYFFCYELGVGIAYENGVVSEILITQNRYRF